AASDGVCPADGAGSVGRVAASAGVVGGLRGRAFAIVGEAGGGFARGRADRGFVSGGAAIDGGVGGSGAGSGVGWRTSGATGGAAGSEADVSLSVARGACAEGRKRTPATTAVAPRTKPATKKPARRGGPSSVARSESLSFIRANLHAACRWAQVLAPTEMGA